MNAITVPGALARFQDDFAHALLASGGVASPAMRAFAAQPAFAVYRNTVMKGCIDALQANYPAVTRLVGEEWLRAAAAAYAREAPPEQPMLLHYAADFADFLARFEPAAELPYLPGVAQLDRYWTEAHAAATEDALAPAAMTPPASANFFHMRLQVHATARWAWFDAAPVYTIWSRNRGTGTPGGEFDWQAEGALLTRPDDAVQWRPLNRAGCAFLDACASGSTLADAVRAALDAGSTADFGSLMTTLLEAGAFSRLHMAP